MISTGTLSWLLRNIGRRILSQISCVAWDSTRLKASEELAWWHLSKARHLAPRSRCELTWMPCRSTKLPGTSTHRQNRELHTAADTTVTPPPCSALPATSQPTRRREAMYC